MNILIETLYWVAKYELHSPLKVLLEEYFQEGVYAGR